MASVASRFLRYVLYGVITCVGFILPWIAVEGFLRRLPGGGDLGHVVRGFGLPDPIRALILVVVLLLALGLVGWLGQRFLWPRLANVPLFHNLVPGVERWAENLGAAEERHPLSVVWVAWPSAKIRTLGVVTGRIRDPGEGPRRLAVALLPGAGQLKSAMLRVVDADQVEATDWTLDEALSFVTSSGALGPVEAISLRELGTEEPPRQSSSSQVGRAAESGPRKET
jgi:uncharacterized membrane protein